MNTTTAPSRVLLLLLVACCAGTIFGQLYQRRVCPKVKTYPERSDCEGVENKCGADDECAGGERCCATENECYLSCQKTVIPEGCPIPIDLALLLDSSGSIGRRNWVKVKKFAKDVTDIYDISEKGTHISIMMYSTKPEIMIKFNKYQGINLHGVNIKRDIDKFRLQRGFTFIDKALKVASNEIFVEEAGMRKNIRKVCLVLTDGIQTKEKGPYTPLIIASQELKDKDVNIYSLGVGNDINVLELIQTATVPDYVFSASNFDDLSRKVTEITQAQCQACEKVVDVVFGIPDSTDIPKPFFDKIKVFYKKLAGLFKLSNRGAHFGIVRYSDTANMDVKLDTFYQLSQLRKFISKMKRKGTGVDVNKAIRVAADHAFTIFGGVRQIIPKTYVIFVPQTETVDKSVIEAAANKLKSMGVRLMFVGLQDNIDTKFYAKTSSQPSGRYLLTGFDMKELIEVASYEASDTICKARYGKCPISEPTADCSGSPTSECAIDSDCKEEGMCCYDNCGSSSCLTRIKNCFVTMDVAFAIDSSAAVSDEDFKHVQDFAKQIVHQFSDSENAIHFGLVQYGATAKTIVDFNKFISDPKIKPVISGLTKNNDDTRRVDLALQAVKKDVFSLEGGMRQGHPRYVIFITGGDTDASSMDLVKASKALRDLKVNVLAVGINSGVSKGFLSSLASNPKYVYSAASANALSDVRRNIEQEICHEKPGKCPPGGGAPDPTCDDPGYLDLESIPCGVSRGDSAGKSGDWACPGEQKCCPDDTGCSSCKDPPNECKKGKYDLTLILESSDAVGKENFNKMKDFAKELISAFFISNYGTRVATVTHGNAAVVNFKLNTIPNVNRKLVYEKIDGIQFQGGSGAGVSASLEKAVQTIYTEAGETNDLHNKSLVIMGTGQFIDGKRAEIFSNQLKQAQVDVFAVPIGGQGDVSLVRNVVSKKTENNAFMTTSFNALKPHLRALTKAICDGAEKLKPCTLPLDIVFGIPTSASLGGDLNDIKKIFNGILQFFRVSNRLAHFGIVQYSNNAAMTLKLNSKYNVKDLNKYINNIHASGNGFNVEAAFKRTADHAFTIFGGVRQTVPKTFVIFVPRGSSTPFQNVFAAAQNLKRMGVKVVVLGLDQVPELQNYRQLIASQPSEKFFFGNTMGDITGSVYSVKETICRGRYGRCPPEPEKCDKSGGTCDLDMDCGAADQMCCADSGCQRSCTTKLDNCFVNMEIALAIDTSQDGAGAELDQVKDFVRNVIRPLATSENSMHISLMTFGQTTQTLARFRERKSESELQDLLAKITPSSETGRDLSAAFTTLRRDQYSLEGGMRQGHPRVVLFVLGGGDPNDFVEAANQIKNLDGMRVMVVATKQSVPDDLLLNVASDRSLAFRANSPADLSGLKGQIMKSFCRPKPGTCPPAPPAPSACSSKVPVQQIPCGISTGSSSNSDWPCPGEQKCCGDPSTGCPVCADPPLECRGVYDLALLLENNDEVGKAGFNKVKTFAKQLIDGFAISDSGTRVAVVSYGDKANVEFKFNSIRIANKEKVKAEIDRIPFRAGGPSFTSLALQKAFDEVYKIDAGARGPGVNKTVLIISQGKFQDAKKSARYSSQLQQSRVDVYHMAIGGNENIPAIRNVASRQQHKTVFITSSYDALKPHLRAVTHRICEGAEKPFQCNVPLDIIYGIPVAKELGGSLGPIKTFLNSLTRRFVISNRLVHIGMLPYSSTAILDKPIDSMYNLAEVGSYISGLKLQGSGYNLAHALKIAADYGFNIYGGTRPSAPKTLVLIVPDQIPAEQQSKVQAAAEKLKKLGVRLMLFGVAGKPNEGFLKMLSTQPSRKFLTYGSYDDFIASTERNAKIICRGRYGKCNDVPTQDNCVDAVPTCNVDGDCPEQNQACCESGCAGVTSCSPRIQNCFVNMDIALAIDTSAPEDTLNAVKSFAQNLVSAIADAENAIHFSLVKYEGKNPKTIANFRQYLSEQKIKEEISRLTPGNPDPPRVDNALLLVKREHFSLEGGMRQGHPRFVIFVSSTGNAAAADIVKASKELRDLNIGIAAVGTSGSVDSDFLNKLATSKNLVFQADSPDKLQGLITNMKMQLCGKKLGECPPVPETCSGKGGEVPLEYIPCGDSVRGKEGREENVNDWDCPGEQRCCKDPTGCFSVCRQPPLQCHGQHDIAFLIDSSKEVGKANFELAKKFTIDIVEAFKIGNAGTRIAVVSYDSAPKVDITFNKYPRLNHARIKGAISRVGYGGKSLSKTSAALQQALDIVYKPSQGAREGVNKSLVIISTGTFNHDQAAAIRIAGLLKLKGVDIFYVPVGGNPDVTTIRKVISKKQENNAFMTTSYRALRPHVAAVTNAICLGAEKIKICDKKADIVFGIPTAKELGDDFLKIKSFYTNMLQLLKVNNRAVHIGLIPYSSTASLTLGLDRQYSRDQLIGIVGNLKLSDKGFNVQEALRVASDHAFTMFGGVRQTASKTFVLFVPADVSSKSDEILTAAKKLKSVGVRLMVLALEDNIKDDAVFRTAVSQPHQKFLRYGNYDYIGASVYDDVDVICKSNYGKCPSDIVVEAGGNECTDEDDDCTLDGDCGGPGKVCCKSACKRKCFESIKNCYVAMDVAFAVDTTSTIADDEFGKIQSLMKKLIYVSADSENNNHFGLLTYGQSYQLLASFRQFESQAKFMKMIKEMKKTPEGERRLDVALRAIKSDIFSLDGGMRQGRPRFAVIVVSGPNSVDSEDLLEASKQLRALGVKIIAVASNAGVDNALLEQLATDPSMVFSPGASGDVSSVWPNIQKLMCSDKPGKCIDRKPNNCRPGQVVPSAYIPCGNSEPGREGRANKENDWDCPGTSRCCKDPSGCLNICVEPPNVCNGQFDVTIVMDASANTGRLGFESVKTFSKELVNAFDIAGAGTRFAVISFSDKATVNFGFDAVGQNSKNVIYDSIDRVGYMGGATSDTSNALQLALDKVYRMENGMRSGSNKSLVIIGPGKYANPSRAARLAGELRQNLVDIFVMPVGYDPDLPAIKKVASKIVDNNVFMTTSSEALRPHLRSLTKRICDGAERPKVCEIPMDVVYGIPTSVSLGDDFERVQSFFTSMTRQFKVGNRHTHIGVIPYSNSARLAIHLDQPAISYSQRGVISAIKNMKKEGSGFNVARAIQVAADYAFTIFGGTRPTTPKTFVLYVPSSAAEASDAIQAAARKLKSVGVKLMVVGLKETDEALYRVAASQPAQKHFLHGNYDDVHAQLFDAVDTICKARYPKCPAYKPAEPAGGCPPELKDECDLDGDCAAPDHACCEGGCGKRTCTTTPVQNCFVTMDIGIAMDVTSGIADETFENQKRIATQIVNSVADAENSIRVALLKYAATSQVIADFNKMASHTQLRDAIKVLAKTGDSERRIDTALTTASSGMFSLEGGMRHGHPKYLIFFASGSSSAGSDDLLKSSKVLRALGVNTIAVGLGNTDEAFLKQLASKDELVFRVTAPEQVDTLWSDIEAKICNPKPGQCPPVTQTCPSPGAPVPLQQIPCGDSAEKAGRPDKVNDWDCPGEARCCRDPSGCHSVCIVPPNRCNNRAHDLAILMERSDATGLHGFMKAKAFAQDLADAFYIHDRGTHVAVATYGPTAEVQYRFNWFQGPQLNNQNVRKSIGTIQYAGGDNAFASGALSLAVDDIFTDRSGAREGVNKSLVLVGSGRFLDSARAIALSASLKQNLVDVFAVPVGPNADVAALRKFVSPPDYKNIFITPSYDALRTNVRILTKIICEGATKIRKCKQPIDVYFGIPNANFLGPQFLNIRKSFVNLLRQLVVSNRLLHVGIMQYSDSAGVLVNLDRTYNRDALEFFISREMKLYGSGLNLAELFNKAADNAFTIYGGVRQTAPKVLVVFIPGPISSNPEDVIKAANKLKGLGVRIVILGLNNAIDKSLYQTIVTQPASKFLLTADTYDGLSLALSAAANRICNAKYGRCPKPPEPPSSCPENVEHECSEDKGCKSPDDLCCKGGCTRTCQIGVKNCFVPMEIAFAIDVSEATTRDAMAQMKEFIRETMRSFADSENDIHFSLMQYAGGVQHLTPGFRNVPSEGELRSILDKITILNDPSRRVDHALVSAKRNIFSLEGRMRHGHPRYLIFLASDSTSDNSTDLSLAREPLDAMNVNTIAVGISKDVDGIFLQQLASENRFVFQASTPEELSGKVREEVTSTFCNEKPGNCPVPAVKPDPAVCASQGEVPLHYIPCGDSAKGKGGRDQRRNDWDCPGEQKCCKDPDTGCHNVCVGPPIVCKKVRDLELVVENSDYLGESGFRKLKQFLKYFVEAFEVSRDGTHVGMVSFGMRAFESFRLNAYRDNKGVQEGIDNVRFRGGRVSSPSDGLTTALDVSFTRRGGARDVANKSLVLFTTGHFENPGVARAVASQLKEKSVDVYTVAIGDNPDLVTIKNVVSKPIERNVFMVSSPDALRAQARALVKTVCDGAEKFLVVIGPPGPSGDPGLAGNFGPRGRRGKIGIQGIPGAKGPKGGDGPPGKTGNPGPPGLPGQMKVKTVPGEKGPVVVPQISYGGAGDIQRSGDSGPPGREGTRGPDGMPGLAGPRGAPGERGPMGNAGLIGPPGQNGRSGEDGDNGNPGRDGPLGDPGRKGPPGDRGKSGQAGRHGHRGRNGRRGKKGDRGGEGERGLVGSVGLNGIDGLSGERGLRGAPGLSGDQGPGGLNGPRGSAGRAGAQGSPGLSGPAGPPGSRGPKGVPGRSGTKGPMGYSGETGTTGEPGSKGIAGRNGEAGKSGPSGPKGAVGDVGSAGEQGPVGGTGARGVAGDSGARGERGERGDAGKVGADGETGSTGASGKAGSNGPQGQPGPVGKRGAPGDVGLQGQSGSAGRRGVVGSQGLQGRQGSKGPRGAVGDNGKRGGVGNKGDAGDSGGSGVSGPNGERGARGRAGIAGQDGGGGLPGENGDDGIAGEGGVPGARGPPGQSGTVGAKGATGKNGKTGIIGKAGPAGPKGEQGVVGSRGLPGGPGEAGGAGPEGGAGPLGGAGDQGATGKPGKQGAAGNSGSEGSKGNIGAAGNDGRNGKNGGAGERGERGDTGAPGKAGEAGNNGSPGVRGVSGGPGAIGADGPSGSTGAPGLAGGAGGNGGKGERGDEGSAGARGGDGEDGGKGLDGGDGGRGPIGAKGSPGESGEDGGNGSPGNVGDVGVRGDQGGVGKTGLNGLAGATGLPGGVGITGAQGRKGVRGERGETGLIGPTGLQGAIGAAGAKGGVGNEGGSGDEGGPGGRGLPGPSGPSGPWGNAGSTGPPGRSGAKGPPGDAGSGGDVGAEGQSGKNGQDGENGGSGDVGPAGSAGAIGTPGESGPGGSRGAVGLPGPAGGDGIGGIKGESGVSGKDGKAGPPGPPGEVGEDGRVGSSGIAGSDGTPGVAGGLGAQGKNGRKGIDGDQGKQGEQGLQGQQGQSGTVGERGSAGLEGAQGTTGAQGANGNRGEAGKRGGQGEGGGGGDKGSVGQKGELGEQGGRGPIGAQGPKGAFGANGPSGPLGLSGARGSLGDTGAFGPPGLLGPAGPAGGRGVNGAKGDRGSSGPEGHEGTTGSPGPPGPPGTISGAWTSEALQSFELGAQKSPHRLYRTRRTVEEKVESGGVSEIFSDIVSLSYEIQSFKRPTGSRSFPAKTCKDLHMCHPNLRSGHYWIDPNEGIPDDAVLVYCDFEIQATCIYPQNDTKTFESARRKWYSGPDGYQWFGRELQGLGSMKYSFEPSQLVFLRLLSDRARQNITYHCRNSAAWFNKENNDNTHSIKIMGDNGVELHASSSNKYRPTILRDDCHIKDGKWRQTVVSVDTTKPYRLPINDVAVYDIGGQGEEFGLDIGPVCFS